MQQVTHLNWLETENWWIDEGAGVTQQNNPTIQINLAAASKVQMLLKCNLAGVL